MRKAPLLVIVNFERLREGGGVFVVQDGWMDGGIEMDDVGGQVMRLAVSG